MAPSGEPRKLTGRLRGARLDELLDLELVA